MLSGYQVDPPDNIFAINIGSLFGLNYTLHEHFWNKVLITLKNQGGYWIISNDRNMKVDFRGSHKTYASRKRATYISVIIIMAIAKCDVNSVAFVTSNWQKPYWRGKALYLRVVILYASRDTIQSEYGLGDPPTTSGGAYQLGHTMHQLAFSELRQHYRDDAGNTPI